MDEMVSIDLAPYIREAVEKMNFEIERQAERGVAKVLRERGWTVIPPKGEDDGTD